MTTVVSEGEFTRLASDNQVAKTAQALEANGIHTIVVNTGEEARACVLRMIPLGVAVYNAPSRTADQIGLTEAIQTATTFHPLRSRLALLDHTTQRDEMRRLIASPDVVIGSVHAITENGEVLLASATGSQISSESFGAGAVIWVAGTQKLVHNLDEGFRRIREYSYPLENERTQQVYGRPSTINKILVVNGDVPGRITLILVRQNLGF